MTSYSTRPKARQTQQNKVTQHSDNLEKLVQRSSLGSNEVIELLASHDTLTKKLTCDYLVDKSVKNSELSLLTANLLLRDASDANPSIRCASLLALSTLPDMEDAAISALTKSMADPSAQVRRTSAICCINIHKHSPNIFLESGLVSLLYEGIRDSDPIVITNCIIALEKVLFLEGSLIINKNIANFLTQNICCFSDCNLVYVLHILTKYSPKSEKEIFCILNSLDCCFSSTVPSVLVSSTHLFLHLVKCYPHLSSDLLTTIKTPISKILSKNIPEVSYLILDYLQSVKMNLALHFWDYYKLFLLRSKDPIYLKMKKLEILPLIATENNINDIILEVQNYTSDFQSFKAAFDCLGTLGSFNNKSITSVFDILAAVFKSPNDEVTVAALECFLTIFQKSSDTNLFNVFINDTHKDLIKIISKTLSNFLLQKNYPVLTILTFQCIVPLLDEVQVLLEELVKQMDSWDLTTQCLFIKVAAVVFLHHPAQTQPILSVILAKLLNSSEQQLKNQAALIYATLEEGPLVAKKVLSVTSFELLK